MYHILRVTLILVFALFFFTACQQATEIQTKMKVYANDIKAIHLEIESLYSQIGKKEEEIQLLKANNQDSEQVSKTEQEINTLRAKLERRLLMVIELDRVRKLPAKVKRGDATQEEIEDCHKYYLTTCPQADETPDSFSFDDS